MTATPSYVEYMTPRSPASESDNNSPRLTHQSIESAVTTDIVESDIAHTARELYCRDRMHPQPAPLESIVPMGLIELQSSPGPAHNSCNDLSAKSVLDITSDQFEAYPTALSTRSFAYSTSSDSTNSILWLEGVAPLETTYPTTHHSASCYESGQLRLCGEIDTLSPRTMSPKIALSRTISLEIAPSRTVYLDSVSTHTVPTRSSSLESIITSPGSNLPLHWAGSTLQSRSLSRSASTRQPNNPTKPHSADHTADTRIAILSQRVQEDLGQGLGGALVVPQNSSTLATGQAERRPTTNRRITPTDILFLLVELQERIASLIRSRVAPQLGFSMSCDYSVDTQGVPLPEAFFRDGRQLVHEMHYEHAKCILHRSVDAFERIDDHENPSYYQALCSVGLVYRKQRQRGTSLEYYNKALVFCKRQHDISLEVPILNAIGLVFAQGGDFKTALQYYLHAIELAESVSAFKVIFVPSVLANIGIVYFDQGLCDLAKSYFLRALDQYKISQRQLTPHDLRHVVNVAERCEQIGEFETALLYYQLALAEYDKKYSDTHPDRLLTLQNLVLLYHRLGDYENGIYYSKQLLATLEPDDSYILLPRVEDLNNINRNQC